MNNQKNKIGISLRVIKAENYLEKRDGLSQDWPEFFKKLNSIPIFIPNTLDNVESYLDNIRIDGIILSGGDNIVDKNPEIVEKMEEMISEIHTNSKKSSEEYDGDELAEIEKELKKLGYN